MRLAALIRKESIQIVRDPSSLLISVVLPLILLFLYGYGVSLDLDHLRIGLVLEDTSPEARTFAESLTNSPYFEVKTVRDKRELLDPLTRGAIRGFVVVPSYFSSFLYRSGTVAPIQVIADGSEPNTANFLQNYVQGAFQIFLEQQSLLTGTPISPLANIQVRNWYNEKLESRYFLLSGSLAIIMTLIGTLLTALVVAREWERGTMEALISTEVTVTELIFGKVIPYFVLGLISMTICVSISTLFFGLPLRGSILLLALTSSVFLLTALSIGLAISTIAKNQIVASQIALVTGFLPAYILSGFLFEIASMPFTVQLVAHIMPVTYFVQSLQTLFLVGNVPTLVLGNLIPMLLVGLLFFLITSKKMVKRLD